MVIIGPMLGIRNYLRTFATANGCEVVLPWFPEADVSSREMRMIRNTREEPTGSIWINYPLATILWVGLSLKAALKMSWQNGKLIRERRNLSCVKQFFQMLYLAWFKNLSPLNYYQGQFYLTECRERAEYFTSTAGLGRLLKQLNSGRPTERLDHKLQAFHSLTTAGLPTVEIIEIFYPDGAREFGKSDEVLNECIGQDFFVKPLNLYGGLFTTRWTYDAVNGLYSNGEITVPSSGLWEAISGEAKALGGRQPEKEARIVQPLLRNHPELEPLSRNALNTVRIETMRFPDGRVEFYHGVFRMAYGDSNNDTYTSVGAEIDLETGCLNSGLSRMVPDQKLAVHPTTGARIEGRTIPLWKDIKTLAMQATEAFPENPIVGWDFAITPDGPLIVEANCNPNFNGLQYKTNQPLTKTLFADFYWSWIASPS